MSSLDHFASDKLAALDVAHLRRSLVETVREDGLWLTRGGMWPASLRSFPG